MALLSVKGRVLAILTESPTLSLCISLAYYLASQRRYIMWLKIAWLA